MEAETHPPQTNVEKVVATLKRAIFTGKLQPGEQLREVGLTKSLNVSRNSVREALRILSTNGLTSYSPNKGVRVRKLNRNEVDDIFLTRSILEKQAAANISNCSNEDRLRITEAMDNYAKIAEANDPITVADAHIHYHAALVGLTGSNRLMEMERSLMQELQVIIATVDSDRDDLENEIEKHYKLTQMLLENRIEDSVLWIENDLRLTKEFVLQHLVNPKRSFSGYF